MEFYRKCIDEYTKIPTLEQTLWKSKSDLCLVYIEFRDIDIIKTNLHNLCNVYGGTDASIMIVHSSVNRDRIMNITGEWKNVRYIEMLQHEGSVDDYNKILTNFDFWNTFSEFKYVLTNQWDSYLFKKIPEKFFEYDYVGAPCNHFYSIYGGRVVTVCGAGCKCDRCVSTNGDHPFTYKYFMYDKPKKFMFNGGFSLRKVETMKNICKNKPWNGAPEDVYFCLTDIKTPSREEASEFSVEGLKYNDDVPCGCHQVWIHQSQEYVSSLF